jgi:hypothetical protein
MTGAAPPNPRLALGLLVLIMALQGFFASATVLEDAGAADESVRLLTRIGFVVYVAFIGAFAIGVWRRLDWAWAVGLVVAGLGLAIAGLQIAAGGQIDRYALGMLIDAALIYYLSKASTRALFDA